MSDRYLELASEFRDRFVLFYLASGDVKDSRLVNWRRVDWRNVVRIEARLRGHSHVVESSAANFRFFLNFKICRIFKDELGESRQRIFWVIGWTDGALAYLKSVDFETGLLAWTQVQSLHELTGHIHPDVQGRVRFAL